MGPALALVIAAFALPPLPGAVRIPRVDNPWFPLKPGTACVYREWTEETVRGGDELNELVAVRR